jgi:hypothetical protein
MARYPFSVPIAVVIFLAKLRTDLVDVMDSGVDPASGKCGRPNGLALPTGFGGKIYDVEPPQHYR